VIADLRAGLIGLGAMGRHHARVLQHLPGVRLVGAADPVGDRHGCLAGPPVLPTVEELLAVGLDYCVLAAPTSEHLPIGLQLAAAGIPTLIEKPISDDYPSALTLADAFARAGVVAAAGHVERYNPAIQGLQDWLAHDRLGELYQVSTRRQGPLPVRVRDIGVVADLATHDIDAVSWVTGRPIASISALTSARDSRLLEDLLVAVGQLTHGVLTHHLVTWLSPIRERLTIAHGARGMLVADTLHGRLTFHPNSIPATGSRPAMPTERSPVVCPVGSSEPLVAEHEAFRDAVRHHDAPIVTLYEAAAVATVTDAILTSAETGGPVAPSRPWSRSTQPSGHDPALDTARGGRTQRQPSLTSAPSSR